MSTPILRNPTSLQAIETSVNVENEPDDVQCDSLRMQDNFPLIRELPDLHQQLIDIDEEIGGEELEGLKFLCRDHVSVSKLDRAHSALEIFDMMQKYVLIDTNNLDFLLECLARIHRFDLVRKLGLEIEAVRTILPNLKKLYPFRTMLMDITEDLDDDETEKVRFFLRGKIRKKALNERKTMIQLFVFMEQEGLLAPNDVGLLARVMESIRRGDLMDMIRKYQGLPPIQRHEPGVALNPYPTNQLQHEVHSGSSHSRGNRTAPQDPTRHGQGTVQGSSGGYLVGQERSSQIERSISAGTLSISSGESAETNNRSRGTIPEPLFLQIADDLRPQVLDLGFELGFSNDQLILYEQQFPDVRQRTRKLLQDWLASIADKGQVAPALNYVLQKLGCKTAAHALKCWMDTFNTATARQTLTNYEPTGPPEQSENNYSSMRHAHHTPFAPQPTENTPVISDLHQTLQQLHINQNQIPNERCVTFVHGVAVYKQGGQIVANAGVSQQLNPMPVVVENTPPCQGQMLQGQMLQGQQVQGVTAGNTDQVITPIIQARSEVPTVPSLPAYRMDRKPRGWCVILNNEKFHVTREDQQSKEMPPRNGTEKDAESLQYMFDKLGFIVRRHDNLSDTEMMNILIDAAHNVDHSQFDCFVCCVLTHGVLNHLYGSNGRLVSIKDLTATFQANRCPTLTGKPKLFFLQACQGRDKMEGGPIERDGPVHVITESDANGDVFVDNDRQQEMIPNEADFLLGYATVPGYVSFRSRNHGSWYIRKLCELLEKYFRQYDLMSILVEVNREVAGANASMDGGLYKQIPAPLVTLRKQLYFR